MNFSLGTVGLVVMNAVLSFVVYPYIGNTLGAAMQGKILFFTSLMALLAGSFGSAANYGRLKIHREEKESQNGEFNLFLFGVFLLTAFVMVLATVLKQDRADASLFGLILLAIFTILRYYGDVNFRLSLNYKQFALYYIAIAVGYGIGLLLYSITKSWVLIFLLGEGCGLAYLFVVGQVLKPPYFERTKQFGTHLKRMGLLSVSYLFSDFVGLSDRLFIPLIMENGDELTSIFYYASLIGKTMSLLSTPLNGVLSGYLFKNQQELDRKKFTLVTGGLFLLSLVVIAGATLCSHLFVRIFYPAYYETVQPLFLLANAGQVMFFLCNIMMVIVLRYTKEVTQIAVNFVYIVVYLFVTIPLMKNDGLTGMAWGIFAVNFLKFILYYIFGVFGVKKEVLHEESKE